MRESTRAVRAGTIVGLALVTGFIAYAVYFDYKRRNDPAFRKKLRKDKKRLDKSVTQSSVASAGVSPDELRTALEKVRNEDVPKTPEEKEQYFMAQVGMGEQLSSQGPAFYLPAAMSFYRALRVYPSPVELIMIYQKTVTEPVFKMVMDMTNLDLKDRVEGYYDYFPPKSMDVAVKQSESTDTTGTKVVKNILVASKDFQAGEVIYKERPIVAVLDSDLERKGTYCSKCFRMIHKGMAIRPDSDQLAPVYCSKECLLQAKTLYQNLLFGSESPFPAVEVESALSEGAIQDRKKAQMIFVEHLQRTGNTRLLLAARFIARQVAAEAQKLTPGSEVSPSELPEVESGPEYSAFDHMERLRYIELPAGEERSVLVELLLCTVPGLEQFVSEERYASLKGQIAYNVIGVCFSGGRDDKPPSVAPPTEIEISRTPYGTRRQIGTGLYRVSSYISHSCEPSTRPSFSSGTSELHLIASRAIKAGDELTMAYVDVAQRPHESIVEARRRRRMELARGWRFACPCARCAREVDPAEADESVERDESKVSGAIDRMQQRMADSEP